MADSTYEPLLASSAVLTEASRQKRCQGFEETGQAVQENAASGARRKMWLALGICSLACAAEVVGGILAHSLALLTDAAHLLSDLSGYCIGLFALWVVSLEANRKNSYGYHRVEILGALLSIVVIWAVTGMLVWEAVDRMMNPVEVDGFMMFCVAAFGLLINLVLLSVLGAHGHSHGGGGGHGHSHGGSGHGHSQGGSRSSSSSNHINGGIRQNSSHIREKVAEEEPVSSPVHVNSSSSNNSTNDEVSVHGHSHGGGSSNNTEHDHAHGGSSGDGNNNNNTDVSAEHGHLHGGSSSNNRNNTELDHQHGGRRGGNSDSNAQHAHSHGGGNNNNNNIINNRDIDNDSEHRKRGMLESLGSVFGLGNVDESINVRAAALHVVGDLVQSIGVIIASVLIWINPKWSFADPICTLVFALLVLITTWHMLREVFDVLMERTPHGVNIAEVEAAMMEIEGVVDVHCLHVWALTSGKYLASAHIQVEQGTNETVLRYVEEVLYSRLGSAVHTTFQVSSRLDCCENQATGQANAV